MMPAPCFNTDVAFGDTLVYNTTNNLKKKRYNSKKDSFANSFSSYSSYNTYVNSISNYSLNENKPTSIYDRYDKYKSDKKELKSYRNNSLSSKNAIYNSKYLNVFDSEATITSISSIQSNSTIDSSFSSATTKRVSFSDEIFYIPPPVIIKEDKKSKLKEKAKKIKESRKEKNEKNNVKKIEKNEKTEEKIKEKVKDKSKENKVKDSAKGEKKKKSSMKRLFKLFNGKKEKVSK